MLCITHQTRLRPELLQRPLRHAEQPRSRAAAQPLEFEERVRCVHLAQSEVETRSRVHTRLVVAWCLVPAALPVLTSECDASTLLSCVGAVWVGRHVLSLALPASWPSGPDACRDRSAELGAHTRRLVRGHGQSSPRMGMEACNESRLMASGCRLGGGSGRRRCGARARER